MHARGACFYTSRSSVLFAKSTEIAAEAKDYPRNLTEFALLHAACSAELGPKHDAWERDINDFRGYRMSDKTREREISTAYLRNGLVNEKGEKDMLWNGWQGVKRGS